MSFWDGWFDNDQYGGYDSQDEYDYYETDNGSFDESYLNDSFQFTNSNNYDTYGEDYGSGDWGWLSGVGDWYEGNKGWIDPVVGFGKQYYKANRAADTAKQYIRDQQPGIDFSKEAIARQRAYMDPAAVEAGVSADLERMSGMLSRQYRREDQPRYAKAFSKGNLGASTFGRQMAMRDAERDYSWTNRTVPAAYDQYYNRGKQLSNADASIAGMFKGNPVLQPEYRDIRSGTNPWQNALLNYIG